MSNNVTYLGRDVLVEENGKYRIVADWRLFTNWTSCLEPFEYNDFGLIARSNIKTIITEHKTEETPFKFDSGADGQWVDIQQYLTLRNEGKTERNIAFDYSYDLAMKKSTAMVGYTVDDNGDAKLDINTLALRPDEATGRSGTKNHARRIRCSAGFVTVRKINPRKNEELSSIIARLAIEGKEFVEEVFVKATNVGTNPYTHERIRVSSRPIDYNTTRVNGQVIEDALAPLRKFYGQFNMHKHNYCGLVNKKSDGRSARTGEYPDPKSPDMLKLYRHQPVIIISPNVKMQNTEHTVKFANKGGLQEDKEITKVERGNDCPECDCNVKIKDMRRGEVLCPQCGLVYSRDTIVG